MRARSAASSRPSARADRARARLVERAGARGGRGRLPTPGDQRAQLLQPLRHPVELAPALQLRRRRGQRGLELQRGLAVAALVEVEPRAQGQQLARERRVAAGEQRREALLRPQRRLARDPRAGSGGSSRAAVQRPSATCSPVP